MSATLTLRNSERGTFKKCRHQWQWTWRDGRQARTASTALRFGDLIHQALAAYYLPGFVRGPDPAETFERLYVEQAENLAQQDFDVWSDEKWAPALDLGIGMLNGYVARFLDQDAEYEILSSEQTFQTLLRLPAPKNLPKRYLTPVQGGVGRGRFLVRVVGTFDGVWRERSNGRLHFKEFKTCSSISEDGLPLDEQASLYYTYGPKYLRKLGLLGERDDLSSIIYTFLRKAVPDEDAVRNAQGYKLNKPKKDTLVAFANEHGLPVAKKTVEELITDINAAGHDAYQLGEVSKLQDNPFFLRLPVYRDRAERTRLHSRVVAEAADLARARAGTIDLYKTPGPLHMPNCRFCSVKEACEVHEAGGDWQSVLSAITSKWDPYAAHELPERV